MDVDLDLDVDLDYLVRDILLQMLHLSDRCSFFSRVQVHDGRLWGFATITDEETDGVIYEG